MTAALAPTSMSAEYARRLTDRIKIALDGTWQLVAEAYTDRAWDALGYTSWDDYATREFGTCRLRLPREERAEAVASLRASGLSLRAIAAVTGDSTRTIRRELSRGANATPATDSYVDTRTGEVIDVLDEVTDAAYTTPQPSAEVIERDSGDELTTPGPTAIVGTDGKTYRVPPPAPKQDRRRPLPDAARDKGFALRQAVDAIDRIADDDRFRNNKEQVAHALRGHLLHVQDRVAALLDQLQ